MTASRVLALLVCLGALQLAAGGGQAQELIWQWYGDGEEDLLGYSVAGAGDVDGDGVVDVIAGASQNCQGPGYARVFSGRDGSILHTLTIGFRCSLFGKAVSGVGDVDGDGKSDLLVGGHAYRQGGVACLFSGASGQTIYVFEGDPNVQLGRSVSGCGDMDLDGHPDLLIGAPFDEDYSGSAVVYSGRTGKAWSKFTGGPMTEGLGYAVSGAGDVNSDGFPDVIVGAPYDNANGFNSGSATVLTTTAGSGLYPLHVFLGSESRLRLGYSVDGTGDVDGDGFSDLVVGADGVNEEVPGAVFVYSGRDGSLLYLLRPGPLERGLGTTVSGSGDVDGDGRPDFLVGNFGFIQSVDRGLNLHSGRTGARLYRFRDVTGGAGRVGDVDGDGLADVLTGSIHDDINGHNSGSALVFSGNDLFLDVDPRAVGAGENLSFSVAEGNPGNPVGLFVVAIDGVATFAWVSRGTFDTARSFEHSELVPPGLTGLEIEFQAVAVASSGRLVDTGLERVEIL